MSVWNHFPASFICFTYLTNKRASVEIFYATFIGTSYPLQRGDVIIMLANGEGEHTNLDGEKEKCREMLSRNATIIHTGLKEVQN